MRIRIAWLPLAAALAVSGCIENPEPDPRVGRARPESLNIPVHFQGNSERLTLEVARDTGRLRLEVWNPGPGRIDSLRFLLKMTHMVYHAYPEYSTQQFKLLREYFLTTGPIGPSDSLDLGEIDTLDGISIHDVYFSVHILDFSQDGIRRGLFPGYAFQGQFRRIDSLGDTVIGHIRGALHADGNFMAGLSRKRNASIEEDFKGMLEPDGRFRGTIFGDRVGSRSPSVHGVSDRAVGSLRAGESGYIGMFHLTRLPSLYETDTLPGPEPVPKDSLEIFIEPYSSD